MATYHSNIARNIEHQSRNQKDDTINVWHLQPHDFRKRSNPEHLKSSTTSPITCSRESVIHMHVLHPHLNVQVRIFGISMDSTSISLRYRSLTLATSYYKIHQPNHTIWSHLPVPLPQTFISQLIWTSYTNNQQFRRNLLAEIKDILEISSPSHTASNLNPQPSAYSLRTSLHHHVAPPQ